MEYVHSLLRYAVLLALILAIAVNLRGWLQDRPVLTKAHMITLAAMVLCHVQLVIGGILYAVHWSELSSHDAGPFQHFIKYEHAFSMLLAIALVTMGRVLSKKVNDQRLKQKRITIFFSLGLLVMLWAIPWPVRDIGHGLGWL